MRRGEVYWATLTPRSGSEQQGLRPVLLISHDGFNSVVTWRSVLVVPISTSGRQANRGPTSVALAKGEGGLPEDSVALCHQITTLDKSKLGVQVGTLSGGALTRVEDGLCAAMGIELQDPE